MIPKSHITEFMPNRLPGKGRYSGIPVPISYVLVPVLQSAIIHRFTNIRHDQELDIGIQQL
jgi:hypothetical protein